MSKPSLDGVDQRIARAHEYLDLVQGKVAPLSAPDSYRLIGHFDVEASEYIFEVEAPEFPSEIGILVSEVAHHLRSALDNLAWSLVGLRGGTPKEDRDVKFPIREHKPRSDTWQATPLPGLRSEDRAIVEEAQPYHYGPYWHRRHSLFLLSELNNVDKHRSLHVGFLATAFTVPLGDDPIRVPMHSGIADLIRFLPPDGIRKAVNPPFSSITQVRDCGEVAGLAFDSAKAADDPAEVVRVRLVDPGPNPEMKMEPEPSFEVSVTNTENPVTIADLQRIRDRVEELVGRFRPAFD